MCNNFNQYLTGAPLFQQSQHKQCKNENIHVRPLHDEQRGRGANQECPEDGLSAGDPPTESQDSKNLQGNQTRGPQTHSGGSQAQPIKPQHRRRIIHQEVGLTSSIGKNDRRLRDSRVDSARSGFAPSGHASQIHERNLQCSHPRQMEKFLTG